MTTLVIGLVFASLGTASAGTKIWLYPDSEDPRNGGHVVEGGTFNLIIENMGKKDTRDLVSDLRLVFSVNDTELLGSALLGLPDGSAVSIDPGELTLGFPTLPCSGRSFPSHGVFPAHHTTFSLGELNAGETYAITVEVEGADGLEVHFDAFGVGFKEAGEETRCFDVSNPSGHDVTSVFGDAGDHSCYELEVDKQADATGIEVGEAVEYVISLANRGSCELTEVVLTEDIPIISSDGVEVPAFTVETATPQPDEWFEDSLVWHLGVLPAGDAITFTITAIFDEDLADGRHVVNTACAVAAELEDPECSKATVSVGEVSAPFGGPGFWCNQIRFTLEERRHAMFSIEELDLWFGLVLEASAVFSELWPLESVDDAQTLLCNPQLAGDCGDRLARHLLTLWFNVAGERIDPETTLGELCPGDEKLPSGVDPTLTVTGILAFAEADLLAGADCETLTWWAQLIDFINNAHAPGIGACGASPRKGARRM